MEVFTIDSHLGTSEGYPAGVMLCCTGLRAVYTDNGGVICVPVWIYQHLTRS